MNWPKVALGEVTDSIANWNPRQSSESQFHYIDLSAVDNERKRITGAITTRTADAPSRARQLIQLGDVLVSTVRPNLNAVAAVTREFSGATASTGFSVLRSTSRLDTRYLYHWVQSEFFISHLTRRATGASYPAVSDRIIKSTEIPLPPLDEQRRIAAILDQAARLKNQNAQLGKSLGRLVQEVFESHNQPSLHNFTTFGDIVEKLEGGRNVVGTDAESNRQYRVLKISSVTTGQFYPNESKPIPADYIPPSSHLVRQGDLLMSRANTRELVGATALVEDAVGHLALPDKLWRLVWRDPSSIEPLYMLQLLQSAAIRHALRERSSGSGGSMKNISKAKLMAMPLPVAPHSQQNKFVRAAEKIGRRKRTVEARANRFAELEISLQTRAFRGEL